MTYKYIHCASRFTEDQKNFYENNGYIIIKNEVSHDEIDKFHRRFLDICENRCDDYTGFISKDPVLKSKGMKGEKVINKLQDFIQDSVFSDYCSNKKVLNTVENIIGPNITAMHSMLINKPPDSDPDVSRHPMHQDLHYFPFRPAEKIVAAWTAMETVNEQNGCLFVVPGSHKCGVLYPHSYPKGTKNSLYHGVHGMAHLPKVNAVMEKGDTIYFHPLLLHGSGPNYTKGFRRAISCHFADSNCEFIDVTNTTQHNIKQEIEGMVQKRLGIKLDYRNAWKTKSKLIKGQPGNFQKYDSHL
ncbi:unnamed protein product [Phyllotreta striolata]|uniref:phytanoyl-CoA dioxygenase n=1 Tax=Phyllotreta striolata TaxID=444603 RepID=A0A9P0GQT8_PHYSR|nr:unnamed protein product [Phyllotreta striolata]